jgi:uncharacterized membrane protein
MKQHAGGSSTHSSPYLSFGPKSLLLGAGALIAYGLSRRSRSGTILATAGGVLAFKAATSKSLSTYSLAKATFLINSSPQKAYDLWRNFENLPRFMSHLKSVEVVDAQHSKWIARGPMDREVCWTAEIIEDRQNERISWRALPDSEIESSGFVEFRADPQKRGTFVTAEVQYSLPGGPVAVGLATLVGKHPEFVVREDLRRFKALVEAGETPTTAGQTHGPRGVHGHIEQILFRETSNHPQPQAPPELRRSA